MFQSAQPGRLECQAPSHLTGEIADAPDVISGFHDPYFFDGSERWKEFRDGSFPSHSHGADAVEGDRKLAGLGSGDRKVSPEGSSVEYDMPVTAMRSTGRMSERGTKRGRKRTPLGDLPHFRVSCEGNKYR